MPHLPSSELSELISKVVSIKSCGRERGDKDGLVTLDSPLSSLGLGTDAQILMVSASNWSRMPAAMRSACSNFFSSASSSKTFELSSDEIGVGVCNGAVAVVEGMGLAALSTFFIGGSGASAPEPFDDVKSSE